MPLLLPVSHLQDQVLRQRYRLPEASAAHQPARTGQQSSENVNQFCFFRSKKAAPVERRLPRGFHACNQDVAFFARSVSPQRKLGCRTCLEAISVDHSELRPSLTASTRTSPSCLASEAGVRGTRSGFLLYGKSNEHGARKRGSRS